MSEPTAPVRDMAEYLADELAKIDAPDKMIDLARRGFFDDQDSPLALPGIALWHECIGHGLYDMARRVADGEFNRKGRRPPLGGGPNG